MKLGLNFLPFALSCMPVDLMQESESSGDVPVDFAKIELPEISIGPLPHEMPGIIEVQKETIKNLENAIQQLVKNFENQNSNKYAFHFVDKYMDWNNATEYCNSFNMFLAYFDNQSELDEYLRLSRIVTSDIQQRWIDGTSQGRRRLDYVFKGKISPPWGAYQPTGQYGQYVEECVALYTTFGWENEVANDMNCARKQPFACRENF